MKCGQNYSQVYPSIKFKQYSLFSRNSQISSSLYELRSLFTRQIAVSALSQDTRLDDRVVDQSHSLRDIINLDVRDPQVIVMDEKSSTTYSKSPALEFEVLATDGLARATRMVLPHASVQTPMFMPVGTYGSVKGLTRKQLQDAKCQVILGNTYHLQNTPGSETVKKLGGLHKFMDYPGAMLTDSGGFQMVSLLHLADITEEGVNFESPKDGSKLLLTPEESISIQNNLGADIIMQLDDVVPSTQENPARFEEATYRTTRWLDRCIAAHKRPNEQNLFPIVQGGLDTRLRDISIKELVERNQPGYAIGGLAGGEDKDEFIRIVAHTAPKLPYNKPRYIMGIGYPLDVVLCSALGGDMYDSVYPTRTARMGNALIPGGSLRIKNTSFKDDLRPIDPDCDCATCRGYTRQYINSIMRKRRLFASVLLTLHNVTYMQRLTREMREAIQEKRFAEFTREFVLKHYPSGELPKWVSDALRLAGISM